MTAIPEPYNEEIRRRFRMARVAKQLTQADIEVVASSTVTNYEAYDISTARLGDLMAIGEMLGMEGRDFITYLVGTEAPLSARSAQNKNLDEVAIYMRECPPDVQALCVAIVRTVTATHRNITPQDQARVATRKQNAMRNTKDVRPSQS